MTSADDNVSPAIDLDRVSPILTTNRITVLFPILRQILELIKQVKILVQRLMFLI